MKKKKKKRKRRKERKEEVQIDYNNILINKAISIKTFNCLSRDNTNVIK